MASYILIQIILMFSAVYFLPRLVYFLFFLLIGYIWDLDILYLWSPTQLMWYKCLNVITKHLSNSSSFISFIYYLSTNFYYILIFLSRLRSASHEKCFIATLTILCVVCYAFTLFKKLEGMLLILVIYFKFFHWVFYFHVHFVIYMFGSFPDPDFGGATDLVVYYYVSPTDVDLGSWNTAIKNTGCIPRWIRTFRTGSNTAPRLYCRVEWYLYNTHSQNRVRLTIYIYIKTITLAI